MTLADAVDEYWPAADGWVAVSVECGFVYVMTLLEHPVHGLAMCLMGASQVSTFDNDAVALTGTPDNWERLDPMTRETWMHGVVNAQAANWLALLARMRDYYEKVEFPTLASKAVAGYALASPVFMDDAVCTVVALTGDRIVTHASAYHAHSEAQGVPARQLLLGGRARGDLVGMR